MMDAEREARLGPYRVRIGRDSAVVEVPSATRPDQYYYNVIVTPTFVTCGCRGFIWRRHCRHTTAVLQLIGRAP